MSRRMRVTILAAGLLGLGLAGAATARDWHHGGFGGRWSALSPEDRAAFADARIAALHAGLKLNPDQEKMWPPVETAMRDMVKLRQQRREAIRARPKFFDDAPGALRMMADAASARGEALRKLADASQPLYASLDPDQKRRAMILARPMGGPIGGPGRMGGRRPDRGPDGRDRYRRPAAPPTAPRIPSPRSGRAPSLPAGTTRCVSVAPLRGAQGDARPCRIPREVPIAELDPRRRRLHTAAATRLSSR